MDAPFRNLAPSGLVTAGMMSFVKYALATFKAFVFAVVTVGSAVAPPSPTHPL